MNALPILFRKSLELVIPKTMKFLQLSFIIILFVHMKTFSQNRIIYGTVLDSITNKPIYHVIVRIESTNKVVLTDSKGNYRIVIEPTDKQINFSWYQYEKKQILLDNKDFNLKTIYLQPLKIDSYFASNTNPTDTLYYANKKIKRINYQEGGCKYYTEKGILSSEHTSYAYREFYGNGNLKRVHIELNSDENLEMNYYKNGNLKSKGNYYFGHKKNRNYGEWIKSNWVYFKRNENRK